MTPVFALRLLLDALAAGLLLFAFSYFWQGNRSHEWAGIGMFVLLVVHNLFHRRWFARLGRPERQRRAKFNTALTVLLLVGMLALLGTSLVISETLFAGLRLQDDFRARQIHAGIAYWLLVVVALHLGLRWPLLMGVARRIFGITQPRSWRTLVLRLVAALIAVQGVFSVQALNLQSKLFFQMSLDWWNFEESVAGFFGHCVAVAGLCIVLTHYAMRWLQRHPSAAASTATPSQLQKGKS